MVLPDQIRRTELGKMLLDVTKYVLTIVVISGLASEKVNVGTILLGAALAIGLMAFEFFVIPLEEENVS